MMEMVKWLEKGIDPQKFALPGEKVLVDVKNTRGRAPRFRGVHMGDIHIDLAKKLDRAEDGARQAEAQRHPQRFTEEDFALLKECGANTARFGFEGTLLESYEHRGVWREEGFEYLKDAIDWGEKYGIRVILDNHNPLGRAFGGDPRLWEDTSFQDRFVETWVEMAKRFSDRGGLSAYEFINEAEPANDNYEVWNKLYQRTLKEVRKIDPDRPVIIDSIHYANPRKFDGLEPCGDPNVIYSFHNYQPTPYHMQKRAWVKDKGTYFYPDRIKGEYWNREEIMKEIFPAVEFSRRNQVPLFCGEFGCVSDCPPMTDMIYLMDEISLFQEIGIGWTLYNYMQLHGDPFWKTHFDCNLYIQYLPENRLYTFKRKVDLIKVFAQYEGMVLNITQPDDKDMTLYGIHREDGWVTLLISNKDQQQEKSVSLALPDLLPSISCRRWQMDNQADHWTDKGTVQAEDGWMTLSLPKLSITRIEFPAVRLRGLWDRAELIR